MELIVNNILYNMVEKKCFAMFCQNCQFFGCTPRLKETLQRNQKHDLPVEFRMDNRRLTNPDKIANEFNVYFINNGRSLSDQIQSQRSSHEYLGDRANTNFTFTAVNEECIDTIVKNMKSKSSTGYDEISNKLIKQARSGLVKPLTL